jgi:hypothetical protein
VTPDLLSVWTDPDTAMRAVGASLGIFDDPVAGAELPSESPLRDALFDVLLTLVDEGQLERRACADGRYAFRWSAGADSSSASTATTSTRLDAYVRSMPRALPSGVPPAEPPAEGEIGARPWPRLVVTTAPLLLPSLSCLLAVTAFVVLGNTVGVVVLGALALIGAVGLLRRVPLAGYWTAGVVVAGLLARLS